MIYSRVGTVKCTSLSCLTAIIESVDSISRDGPDCPYM